MNRISGRHYFDLSTLLALGIAAFLLVSLPGGCGDSEETEDEEDISSEEVAEPTAPPMLEIVDPEPGDLNMSEPDDADESQDGEPPADDGEEPAEGEEGGENAGDEGQQSGAQDGVYVVQQGDTLYDIAVQLNVSMEVLMNANGMDDPNQLQVGQELQVPN